MKKLLLIALLGFAFTYAHSQELTSSDAQPTHQHIITDLDAFAREWARAAVTDLNQEELELLGTFLYYDIATSFYELALRNSLLDLQRGSQILSFKVMSQGNTEESTTLCAQLKALLEQLETDLAPSRNYFISVWQLCNKEIEQCQHNTLISAVENLKQLGQRALNNWAVGNKQEITKLLEKSHHTLSEVIGTLTLYHNVLKALADDTFPYDEQAGFKDIQTVDNCLGISQALYAALFNADVATDEIMGVSFGMIGLNAALFNSLYRAFYEELEQKNLLPMPIVINEQGFIPAELRTQVLPKFSLNNE